MTAGGAARSVGRFVLRLPTTALMVLVRGYQLLVSPLLGPSCRFYPSCSAYAAEAVSRHGLWRGGRLAYRRIRRCNPRGGRGPDPVPATLPSSSAG